MMLQRNPNLLALTPMQLSSHHTGAFQPSRNLHCQSCTFCKGKAKNSHKQMQTFKHHCFCCHAQTQNSTTHETASQVLHSSPVCCWKISFEEAIKTPSQDLEEGVQSRFIAMHQQLLKYLCSTAAKAQHDFQRGKQRHRNITQQTCTVILHSNPKQ